MPLLLSIATRQPKGKKHMPMLKLNQWKTIWPLTISLGLATGCVTPPLSGQQGGSEATTEQRLYWKVYPKSDNTFYLLPRPELTRELSTPEKMNSLPEPRAREMAQKLNAQLHFEAKAETESGQTTGRVHPEPLLEDILAVCRKKFVHPFLESRCKKELSWQEKGQRPDIYLMLDTCQAAALADALNNLYGKSKKPSSLCPEKDHVAK